MINHHNLILSCLTILVFCSFANSQSLPELEKVRQIKLLESTQDDVRKMLAEYILQPNSEDIFETQNAKIEVTYSAGGCKSEYDSWDVPESKVNEIKITPKNDLKLNKLGFDLSKFKKENQYTNVKTPKIYHRKNLGILILATNEKVEEIILEPSKKYYPLLCDKQLAKRLLSTKSYFDPAVKDRNLIIDYFSIASVTNLVLSASEITVGCFNTEIHNGCSKSIKEIAVLVVTENPDGAVLTYHYFITGGKIVEIGGKPILQSEKVFWDLSDAKPGTYKITAAVDSGCGFCGKTITKTVTVKECPDCKNP